jgi:probable phosphoglycerate mutase
VLVRHGVGRCNEAGVIGGRQGCTGLSEQGRLDSEQLAERLAAMAAQRPFDVLLSSPRLRVLECARIVARRLGQPVVVVPGLAGQEFGAADGRPWQRVTRTFGGPPMHDPDRPIARGAESWNDYADRVLATLGGLLVDHAGRRLCVVGHGRMTALAAALLGGAPDPRVVSPDATVEHGELTVWRRDAVHWVRERVDATV